MYLPSLQPVSKTHYYVSGDVTIDECAAIAPGVIFQADPGCRILIAAGACIGMGAVLHAHQGNLEVEVGANLGSGVLVFGQGKIGSHACIGSATTILNASIEPAQVVPPASVIGDTSRQLSHNEAPAVDSIAPEPAPTEEQQQPVDTQTPTATDPAPVNEPVSSPTSETLPTAKSYGQVHLNQLLTTLFPHKQSLNPKGSND